MKNMKLYFILALISIMFVVDISAQELQKIDSEDLVAIDTRINSITNVLNTIKFVEASDLETYLLSIVEFEIVSVRVLVTKLVVKYGKKILLQEAKKLIEVVDKLRILLVTEIPNLSFNLVVLFLDLTDKTLCVEYTKNKLNSFKEQNLLTEEIYNEYEKTIYLYGDTTNLFCEQGLKCLKVMKKLQYELNAHYNKNNTPTTVVKNNCITREPAILTRDRFIHIIRRHLEDYYVIDNLNGNIPTFFDVKTVKDLNIILIEILKTCKIKISKSPVGQPINEIILLYNDKPYNCFITKVGFYVHSIHPKEK